jgi:hypothetical protein
MSITPQDRADEFCKRLAKPTTHTPPKGDGVLGQGHKSRGPMADSTLSEDEKRAEREAKNPPV